MQNAMGEEERPGGRVVELAAIVTLDGFDGVAELGRHIRRKVSQCWKSFRLGVQGKHPNEVRAIIKNDKIIFKTGHTSHGRGPQITMY